jgi:formate hydrogenlyase subunit 6/NADH:ubiquinone oxidoreductase subunit I
MNSCNGKHASKVIDRQGLDDLFSALRSRGYTLVGPKICDQVIVYDEIQTTDDLPVGWTDEQEAGSYRLKKRDDDALFGYVVGPHSWKKYLFPPAQRLWQVTRDGEDFNVSREAEDVVKRAFIAVRSCELHAMAIQAKVFTGGEYVDPTYHARSMNAFTLAVNCGQAGNTCFCASMNTGPKVAAGFDLALTEILEGTRHEFLVEVGSELGAEVLRAVASRDSEPEDHQTAEEIVARAAAQMGLSMDTTDISSLLKRNHGNMRWDEVAERCLSCANCTMVCPTCFCSTVEDVTDLSGDHAERWRRWDSCFTMDFSHIAGGNMRSSTKSRYRQWMTHKLATWHDQFGTSGCVGCGRCITWCPVAIDITEEVAAIRRTDVADEPSLSNVERKT